MPKVNLINSMSTRSNIGYIQEKFKGEVFEKSFFPNTLKLWNNLPKDFQRNKDLLDFKTKIKQQIKPPRYKHFSKGQKLGNSLLTKVRVGRSDLKQHRFMIGLEDSPNCLCHFDTESPEHYFLDCFLYSPERLILFNLIEHYIPNFPRLNKKQKLDIILRGVDIDNPEILSTNITLTKSVQNYIISSKRFL